MDLIKNSEVFRKLSGIAGSINNPVIDKLKKDGGKVAGYTCSFVPEEILIAAGLMPFRIRGTGSKSADLANDYFQAANICSMVRHCFNHILTGEYDFLDAAIIGGGCDANRHILDNWEKSDAKIPFLHRIFFPHATGDLMVEYFRNQLADMKAGIEKHFGVEITDDKIWNAIKLCNEARDLQKELYSFRKADNPPITGAETVDVIVAGNSMPKEEYIADLKTLLNELKSTKTEEKNYKARLMIIGPCHDDTSMCDIIEGLGGITVTDLTCFGAKIIYGGVKNSGTDPLQAIAEYQVQDRPFCPKNLGAHPIISKTVFENIKDYKVDGIIGQNMLCCDTWGGELYILNKELKEAGIPMLRIEREYIPDSIGQIQTRVQAFLETITGGTQ